MNDKHPLPPPEYLSAVYEGNGLFAHIIDMPAEDAAFKGFELEGLTNKRAIDYYEDAVDYLEWEETAATAMKWARLFGGSLVVMLIDDGKGLEDPVDLAHIRSVDELVLCDCSVVKPIFRDSSRPGDPSHFRVFTQFGSSVVHESRCLLFRNGELPERAANEQAQQWGIPEYVRIRDALCDAEISHGSLMKMFDRIAQPVYCMKGLAGVLAAEGGAEYLIRRLEALDLARSMTQSILIDAENEEYDYRSINLTGISEVIDAACELLSAVTGIPQLFLFGMPKRSINGRADRTTIENYYNYVERLQERMLRGNLFKLLKYVFLAGAAQGEIKGLPNICIRFKSLWSMSALEQADADLARAKAELSRAKVAAIYVHMGAITGKEVRRGLAGSHTIDAETLIDE